MRVITYKTSNTRGSKNSLLLDMIRKRDVFAIHPYIKIIKENMYMRIYNYFESVKR